MRGGKGGAVYLCIGENLIACPNACLPTYLHGGLGMLFDRMTFQSTNQMSTPIG